MRSSMARLVMVLVLFPFSRYCVTMSDVGWPSSAAEPTLARVHSIP